MNDAAPLEPPEVRLARSRAELLALYEPDEQAEEGALGGAAHGSGFPRSMTMKLLSKGAGAGGMIALALALFAVSPAKAMRLLRYLPMNAITKILVAQLINARGAKP